MGEFADMAVDQALNGDYWDWGEDAEDLDDWGPGYLGRPYRGPRPKTCRSCGQKDLYWGQVDGRWLLHEYVWADEEHEDLEKVVHVCKMRGWGRG